ncbi:MAG: Vms1/Ankzf1 family peptidyl-tRNA hydrolase, partial [Chloroflexi bacterium]|nr:Vms1/Ankzf1 family peptidyl-tRNA hydrolase [Chloroflexota bacterium]
LKELESRPPAFSIYTVPSTQRSNVEKILEPVLDRGVLFDELVDKAEKSPTGSVIFYSMDRAYMIRPPFPVKEDGLMRGYHPSQLKLLIEHDWKLALILIRLGLYAIGSFKGEELVEYKAGTGLVHARHHKGGSSAQRFARHRAKQMEYFFTRIEGHAREIIEPGIKGIDYVLYGGTRATLLTMWKQCDFFNKLEPKVVHRLLTVREPKYSSLKEAIEQAYTSTVFEFEE